MRYSITVSCIICAIVICSVGTSLYAEQSESAQASSEDARQLSSPEKPKRERVLANLSNEYHTTSREILVVLQEAAGKHREDDAYHSPLHCAILAVDAWHVLDADTLLFSVADYELDVASFPLGISVGGGFFYPAANTLVRLRVDTNKVLDAMKASKNERELQLLTWVLFSRVGSEDARLILENDQKKHRNEKIAKAIELLDLGSDLLPAPGTSRKEGKG